ncbi:ABC transporter permease [Actinosynnema sp. NPDC050436]|uniref:ABC transporter permease n=1 Tax=Actinosynnema sp. NPDC050436 TaxID=3155659 RepID=UPI0033E9D59D
MNLEVLSAATRMQFSMVVRRPSEAVALVTTPLLSTVVLSIVDRSRHEELVVPAVVGTSLMGLWTLVVTQVGGLVDADRWMGRLELLVIAPAPLPLVVIGRLVAIVSVGAVAFAEAVVVAVVGFGVEFTPRHPVLFASATLATLVAVTGAGAVLSALFVLSRAASQFQAALTFPLYVLGAVVFPVDVLPEWARPLADLVFLHWSAVLLRDAVAAPEVGGNAALLLALFAFGAAGLAAGALITRSVEHRIRAEGTAVMA